MTRRILHVLNISYCLPHFIGDQFDYFKLKGFELYVVCSPSNHLFEYAKLKGFTAVPLPIGKKVNIIVDIKTLISLIQFINDNQIDIVIGHTPKGALLGMLAACCAGVKKRIYFRHGLLYETSKGMRRLFLILIERLTGWLATKVVCVSKSVLKISNECRLSSNIKNIILNKGSCNGVDFKNRFNRSFISDSSIANLRERFNIQQSDKVIGYVGRLVNDKGINELIAAWKILLLSRKDLKLLLIGPCEERDGVSEGLKNYIKNEKSILDLGFIEDIAPYYCLMDIFVLPSRREGFPTVVLEASCMGLPIVTRRSTGCIDSIIEDKTGIFTSSKPTDIADKIIMYLDNPKLAQFHGENGTAFIRQNFEQSKIWEEIENRVL